jgi:REP element-mobilizing transposase RayT
MPDKALAYFITFSAYGTWLHGEAPGSVDRDHNQFETPWIDPDQTARDAMRRKMTQEPYHLDERRRSIVRDAIVEECRFRNWSLLALHVRSNHVHLVVSADRVPEFVMRACKSHASKRLNEAGLDNADRKRWTAHGSTQYLWTEDAVVEKADYTLHQQGEKMAVYPDQSPSASEEGQPEPVYSGQSPSASEDLRKILAGARALTKQSNRPVEKNPEWPRFLTEGND